MNSDPQHPEDDPIDLKRIRRIFPDAGLAEDLQEIEL